MTVALPAALAPLARLPRWVLWRYEVRAGRRTKVPYSSRTRRAMADKPLTWRYHDKLQDAPGFDGVGIMLGDGLQGVDLDACIDADGVLEPWAAEIVDRLAAYTEVSPSGRGLKLLFKGPPGKSAEVAFGEPVELAPGEAKRREVAYFTGTRYFTITGRLWRDAPLRQLDEADARWLRERIQQLRQAERQRSSKAPRTSAVNNSRPIGRNLSTTARAGLPARLLRLVRDGAPEGERSEKFFHAVRWCADCGLAAAAITTLIEQYPEGIGAKYAGRIATEVARALEGYTPKTARRPSAAVRGGNGSAPANPNHGSESTGEANATEAIAAEPDFADFANPVEAATAIVRNLYQRDGHRVLHYWQAEFHWWAGSHYVVLPMADVRELLYRVGPSVSKAPVKKRTVDDVQDALRAAANLSHRLVPSAPAWTTQELGDPEPRALIPCRNGLVRIDDHTLLPPTPRLFVPYSLPFDFTADAPPPVAWFTFLASLWRDDRESIDTLQEWLGLLLTVDTSMQKALIVVGPRRSGKGTIGRLIVKLCGERNVASPTLASLGNNFGLEPLIGKTVALMSDARLGAKADIAAIAENLLRVTGEDSISVDRKFREAYTSKLLARVVVLTNEMPVFRDAASALPSRFVVLRTTQSFYGREDAALDAKLTAELPGILLWALVGLRRLRERGRFVQPASAMAHIRLMEDLASPIGAFLRDECILEPGAEVPVSKLYEKWRAWCKDHGRDQPGTEQTFGRDVAAAVPALHARRPRIDGARVRMYGGIRLRNPDDPEHEDHDGADE